MPGDVELFATFVGYFLIYTAEVKAQPIQSFDFKKSFICELVLRGITLFSTARIAFFCQT